jgi:hypothetical protein
MIIEIDFGVLTYEIESPEDLKCFNWHKADIKIQSIRNDALFVIALDDLFNLSRMIGEVMD